MQFVIRRVIQVQNYPHFADVIRKNFSINHNSCSLLKVVENALGSIAGSFESYADALEWLKSARLCNDIDMFILTSGDVKEKILHSDEKYSLIRTCDLVKIHSNLIKNLEYEYSQRPNEKKRYMCCWAKGKHARLQYLNGEIPCLTL